MKIFMKIIMILCFVATVLELQLCKNIWFTSVGIILAIMIYRLKMFDKEG